MSEQPIKSKLLPTRPILDQDLDRVCQFLHENLNKNLSLAAWKNAFCQPWMPNQPNHGFMFVDKEQVVGVFGAIYSEQIIHGQKERFCNHNSWVVLETYRHQSMDLFRALMAQKEYHITTLTANPTVTRIYQYKKHTLMSNRLTVIPNFPWPKAIRSQVIQERAQILALLPPDSVRDYRNHCPFPWLGQVALGNHASGYCHVVFKRKRWKRLPAIMILHISDSESFMRHYPALGRYLLRKFGVATIHVPTRFLPSQPPASLAIIDTQPRFFLSDRLPERDISFLYTEIVALDLE